MKIDILNTIKNLYKAFSDIPRPTSIGFCSHCSDFNPYNALLNKQLREITTFDLEDYTRRVLYTAGSEEDFLYFLPRILELTTNDTNSYWIDREIIFKKIQIVDWHNWPATKKNAFQNYLDAIISSFSTEKFEGYDIDSWICALSQCTDHIVHKLDVLFKNTKIAKHNLINFYEWQHESVIKGKLSSSFWEKSNSNYKEILSWLQSEKVTDYVNEIYNNKYTNTKNKPS